jgi:hypothetical protein
MELACRGNNIDRRRRCTTDLGRRALSSACRGSFSQLSDVAATRSTTPADLVAFDRDCQPESLMGKRVHPTVAANAARIRNSVDADDRVAVKLDVLSKSRRGFSSPAIMV